MKNSYKIFLMISSLLFLSSCIKENVYHKIDSNGQSQIKAEIDMSGMIALTKSFASGSTSSSGAATNSATGADICRESQIADTGNMSNAKCVSTGLYKATITGDVDMTKNNYLTSSGNTLVHDLISIEMIMAKKGESKTVAEPVTSDSSPIQTDPKSIGIEMTYTVEYPGEIIKSDIGEITGNKVKIDLLELQKLKKATVISVLPEGSKILSAVELVPTLSTRPIRFRALNLKQQKQITNLIDIMTAETNNQLKLKISNQLRNLNNKKIKSSSEKRTMYILIDILQIANQKAPK